MFVIFNDKIRLFLCGIWVVNGCVKTCVNLWFKVCGNLTINRETETGSKHMCEWIR